MCNMTWLCIQVVSEGPAIDASCLLFLKPKKGAASVLLSLLGPVVGAFHSGRNQRPKGKSSFVIVYRRVRCSCSAGSLICSYIRLSIVQGIKGICYETMSNFSLFFIWGRREREY